MRYHLISNTNEIEQVISISLYLQYPEGQYLTNYGWFNFLWFVLLLAIGINIEKRLVLNYRRKMLQNTLDSTKDNNLESGIDYIDLITSRQINQTEISNFDNKLKLKEEIKIQEER